MSGLIELAARVEAAEGPDRELDAEIALAVGIVRERAGECFFGHRDYSVMVLERGYYDIEGSAPELPHLTASLDAAMTLVPEGCRFNLNKRPYAEARRDGFHAQVWFSRYYENASDMPNAWAATPALALVAAALRARASGQGEGGSAG
jgi:hypothetical protein